MSPTHPGLYVLSIILLVLSLVSFAIMQLVVKPYDSRPKIPLMQQRNFWAVPWFVCAVVAGIILFPAANVLRHSSNGFGRPGYVLAWLGAEFAGWVVGSTIVFSVTNRLRKKRSYTH